MKDKHKLEELIASQAFHNIDSELKKFNIFRVLGLVNMEIRHSTFLAWLLDPKESHGLKDFFLKEFLRAYFQTTENKENAEELERFTFQNVEIKREWKNIDILIHITEEENEHLFVIENKIWSGENDNQLERYQTIFNEADNIQTYYLYLVPDTNKQPKNLNGKWDQFLYSEILPVIDSALEQENVDARIRNIIDDYRTIIKQNILMNDDVIKEMCRGIWQEHGDALDVLIKNKPNVLSDFHSIFRNNIEEKGFHFFNNKKNEFKSPIMESLENDEYLGYYLWADSSSNTLSVLLYLNVQKNNKFADNILLCLKSVLGESLKNGAVDNYDTKDFNIYKKELLKVKDSFVKVEDNQEIQDSFDHNFSEFLEDALKIDKAIDSYLKNRQSID